MALADELRAACLELRAQEPLSKHTSLAIGGPADFYADVHSIKELAALRKITTTHKLPVFFLGAGSNLLVSDLGIRGLVIHLQGDFREVTFKGATVKAGAGVMMPALAKQAAGKGLAGIESLIGVPGTLGGGLVMNAGTREGWLGSVVTAVEAIGDDLKVVPLESKEFGFSYRHSNLEGRWIVGAELALRPDEPTAILRRIDDLLQYRTRTQPLTSSNCGSVFKNPPEGSAAQWIEKAGLKGMGIGGARISLKHANFIVNENNATAKDVRMLMREIQNKVLDKFSVRLEPEVKLAGEW